ncbi:MAG TPA: sigma-70 family RNA polymerase sigma factor [Gaiellaceae bacterium]|nr:sigma-70 family RNA polymerase sigma factor [Gaiellaceae bacterium]
MSHQPLGTPSDESASPPPEASDVELLAAIAGGSEPAFEELRSRYRRAVERVCRAVAGSEREDCEQEVFARVWGKAALFDPTRGSAAAWLLTLARRTALNQLAARRPPTPVDQEPVAGAAEPNGVDAFWLETALQRLSEHERAVIELAYYGDLSESAIARRLRVPLGSVKSWKRRGLNRLATLLEKESP